jgi:hypothetical protein
VGRFSTPVEPSPISHNHWSVQQILFDEVPGVPMIQYPSDWMRDAIWAMSVNDFGNRMVANVGGTWTLMADANAKSGYRFASGGIELGIYAAAYVYLGYGFQFWAPTGPTLGKGQLVLDGNVVGTVDFYSAAVNPSSMLFELQNVVSGLHTLTLQQTATKNGASSGYTVYFDALKVMI